jgi:hypothetical protein
MLEKQHTRYVSDLREQFEGEHGVIPRMNAETQELKDAESRIIGASTNIARTANKSLAQVTGNGQFCYLMATIPVGQPNSPMQWQLAKLNSGPLPLDVCHVMIHENIQVKSAEDAERAIRVIADTQLGPLPPGKIKGHSGTQGFTTDIVVPEGSYYIQINTRNDYFYETLTIHPHVPGKGLETIEVRNQDWKVVHSEPYDHPDVEGCDYSLVEARNTVGLDSTPLSQEAITVNQSNPSFRDTTRSIHPRLGMRLAP